RRLHQHEHFLEAAERAKENSVILRPRRAFRKEGCDIRVHPEMRGGIKGRNRQRHGDQQDHLGPADNGFGKSARDFHAREEGAYNEIAPFEPARSREGLTDKFRRSYTARPSFPDKREGRTTLPPRSSFCCRVPPERRAAWSSLRCGCYWKQSPAKRRRW